MVKRMDCPKCSKPFNHKGKYKKHLLSHEGVKPFKCQQCGVELAAEWILKRHLETKHSGLKPYTCFQCKVSFTSKDHLHRHFNTRKHTPFNCEKCKKQFLRVTAFMKHRCQREPAVSSPSTAIGVKTPEIHQDLAEEPEAYTERIDETIETSNSASPKEPAKPTEKLTWRCSFDHCGKDYSTRFNLRTHIRTAHEKLGFTCEYCKSIIMHNHSLQKHLILCKEAPKLADNNEIYS